MTTPRCSGRRARRPRPSRLIAEAGLGSDDARILDVGTGVGGLRVGFEPHEVERTWDAPLGLVAGRRA